MKARIEVVTIHEAEYPVDKYGEKSIGHVIDEMIDEAFHDEGNAQIRKVVVELTDEDHRILTGEQPPRKPVSRKRPA